MEMISLRELCNSVGVSRRVIQRYENLGLMVSTSKNKYGHLLYNHKALERAKMVRFLQEIGFKLREIKEIIDAPNNVLKEALERRVVELKADSGRLEHKIKETEAYIKSLEE